MAAAIPLQKAHQRTHHEQRGTIWGGIILSTCLHFAVFGLWPAMAAEDIGTTSREIKTIEIPLEVIVPPAPEALARPPVPVISDNLVDDDITIPPTTWDVYRPVDSLPPPTETAQDPGHDRGFTPFTVAPTLRNRDEVARALEREYPALLRDAQIGGVVHVWFHIDEEGQVLDARVERSSGHQSLDQAALRVAEMMRFSPALNLDKAVPVWVQFPVRFQVRE